MLLFEFFISAIPSFVLSLQPNTNRVKGKFIPYVLSRALPGAITMALAIMTIYILNTSLGEAFGFKDVFEQNSIEYQGLMVLALTFGGLVMLYQICKPFNVIRAILFIGSTACCILFFAVPSLGNLLLPNWSSISWKLPQVLLMIIIVQGCFPISGWLIRGFDMINPVDEAEKEEE